MSQSHKIWNLKLIITQILLLLGLWKRPWKIFGHQFLAGTPFIDIHLAHHDDVLKCKHFPHYWPFVRGIPSQRPVTRSFDVFFDLRLNKRFSRQSWGWWFETPLCPLWRHRNAWLMHRFGVETQIWQCQPSPAEEITQLVCLMNVVFVVRPHAIHRRGKHAAWRKKQAVAARFINY